MPAASVITMSDSRSSGNGPDESGQVAVDCITTLGMTIAHRRIIPDDAPTITATVSSYIGAVDLILTTGGTGIGPRDVTPEAIRPLMDRDLPGFGELMRTGTYSKTPLSILSRGGAGVAGKTLIVMLPGSPKAVRECLELLGPAIKHAIKVLNAGKLDCQGESGEGPTSIT